MGRFVKKRGKPPAPALLLPLLLLLLLPLLHPPSLEPANAPFIHPSVPLLLETGPATVFVVATDLPPGLSIKQVWRFGKMLVAEAEVRSMQQLLQPGVVSVYPEAAVTHPDVASMQPLAGFDVKLKVHEPSGLWCGRNVTVAVIDTGVDYLHPDLSHAIRVLVSTVVVTKKGSPLTWIVGVNGSLQEAWYYDSWIKENTGTYAWMDVNGHGTHVAGIIASRSDEYPGLAPCVNLIVVKAFDGGAGGFKQVLSALEWIYHNAELYGIRVLSLSWGAAVPSDGRDPLSVACDEISRKNVLVFAAAGNMGNVPNTILAPAAAHMVYAVGAWDGYQQKIAPFSSLGPTVDGRMKPDIYAAGVMVVSTRSRFSAVGIAVGDRYAALSGTSMAAPAAAACAASFIEMYTAWKGHPPSRREWESYLLFNSRRFNPLFKDFVTGLGLVKCP